MANPNPNTSGLRPGGWTDEQRAKSIATRKMKADKRWAQYLENLRLGQRPATAAKNAGLGTDAIRKRRTEDPAWLETERQAESEAAEVVEEALLGAAVSGNVPAQQMWLKKRSAERWADEPSKVEVEHKLAIEAGPRMERIAALMARLEQRQELNAGPPDIEGEVVE